MLKNRQEQFRAIEKHIQELQKMINEYINSDDVQPGDIIRVRNLQRKDLDRYFLSIHPRLKELTNHFTEKDHSRDSLR